METTATKTIDQRIAEERQGGMTYLQLAKDVMENYPEYSFCMICTEFSYEGEGRFKFHDQETLGAEFTCYACGKDAADEPGGSLYHSHPLSDCKGSDGQPWADVALCLCSSCADATKDMTTVDQFMDYKASVAQHVEETDERTGLKLWTVTYASFAKGLELYHLMIQNGKWRGDAPASFYDAGDWDAVMADVALQLSIFGEVIYG